MSSPFYAEEQVHPHYDSIPSWIPCVGWRGEEIFTLSDDQVEGAGYNICRVATATFRLLATLCFHFVLPATLCFREPFEAQNPPLKGKEMSTLAANLWFQIRPSYG